MAEEYDLIHERVDDIPLLIGLAQKLRLPEIMDKHLGAQASLPAIQYEFSLLCASLCSYVSNQIEDRKSEI